MTATSNTRQARPQLLTLRDAAIYTKLCTRTVRRLIERGELKALKIGRSIRIRDEDLELYILRSAK